MVKPTEPPLIVIVGPTASGKSEVALRIAKKYSGEIICADSRTIYKGMDIGTAKPSVQDRNDVPHWGLDLVEPDESFSAANFQRYAKNTISDIRARGKIPVLVGGSGLYVDGVILDYQFEKSDPELRSHLEKMSLDELLDYCQKNNVKLPENSKNTRYVIRAIERELVVAKGLSNPQPNTIVVGIATERTTLSSRIHERSEHIFESGVVEEARVLADNYGWDSEAMTANIYRLVKRFLDGDITYSQLKLLNEQADRKLVKKQLTWFKRRPFIVWMSLDEAYGYIDGALAEFVQS
jgi:tRNA dimethylallyltransferase